MIIKSAAAGTRPFLGVVAGLVVGRGRAFAEDLASYPVERVVQDGPEVAEGVLAHRLRVQGCCAQFAGEAPG